MGYPIPSIGCSSLSSLSLFIAIVWWPWGGTPPLQLSLSQWHQRPAAVPTMRPSAEAFRRPRRATAGPLWPAAARDRPAVKRWGVGSKQCVAKNQGYRTLWVAVLFPMNINWRYIWRHFYKKANTMPQRQWRICLRSFEHATRVNLQLSHDALVTGDWFICAPFEWLNWPFLVRKSHNSCWFQSQCLSFNSHFSLIGNPWSMDIQCLLMSCCWKSRSISMFARHIPQTLVHSACPAGSALRKTFTA